MRIHLFILSALISVSLLSPIFSQAVHQTSVKMSMKTRDIRILGIIFWKEKLTWKMIFGIVVCMSGVIWVSMARGQSTKDSDYISTTS